MAGVGRILKIVEHDSIADAGQIDFEVYSQKDVYPEEYFYDLLTYEDSTAAATMMEDLDVIHDFDYL